MSAIQTLTIKGFKSIESLENLELRPLNVLIGGNGAGKSNFISFFKLLNELIEGRLQVHVGQKGGSDALLHYGPRHTRQIEADIRFASNGYSFTLVPTSDSRLIFGQEKFFGPKRIRSPNDEEPVERTVWAGHAESVAPQQLQPDAPAYLRNLARSIVPALQSWRVYHFHDTSDVANVKRVGGINDNAFLRPDASNLAAFLYRLQQTQRPQYEKIRDTVRLVAPGFDDFNLRPWPLDPSGNSIALEWREQSSDYPFLAHQLSDGTLRFICLATLLLQPQLPSTILIDEPELGLHPYALNILASLLKATSLQHQLIVATQSVTLVDLLAVEDLLVVERSGGKSIFKRLDPESMKEWLEDYSLGQLWMKNVLGGRPSR